MNHWQEKVLAKNHCKPIAKSLKTHLSPFEELTMTAESMLANGAFIMIGLTLLGLAWGFVIIKLQGSEE
jgi:cytochrome b6-f complex subunit 7